MKKEIYAQASHFRHKIEDWEKQIQTLEDARKRVINTKKKEDADALAALIMELIKTDEGNDVVIYLTDMIVRNLNGIIKEYEKRFEEL